MGTIGCKAWQGAESLRAAVAGCAVAFGLLHAGDAAALSLGRLQGAPTIGQRLQLTIPFTIAAGEETPCVRADLQQGDGPASRLDWRIDFLDDERRLLRLDSPQPVAEPVLTVNLTLGCAQTLARGFVLLADPPAATRESFPLPARPVPPAAPVRKVDGWNFEADLGPSSRAAVAPAPPPATRKTTRPAAHPQASARRSGPAAGRPRLSLELLDVAIDQAAPLKPSGTLAAPGQPGALPRAEAAAAWQALRTPPTPEVAQALQAANEAELRQLRGLAQRQADQLNKLEHERDLIRDIVAALAGAIALGLGVLLWRRTRETRRAAWWDDEQDRDRQPLRAAPPPPAPAPPPEDVDSGWSEMGASQVSSQPATLRVGLATLPDPTTAPVAAPAAGFGDSVLGRGRLPSAEELLDVQERANFFMAINQHDQAIELLETRLLEHYGTSPFLWLDLLDLCRTLDRPDDYERVRRRFQRAFAARLPAFEAPPEHSEGLERYPRALSRIELLWPTQKVLQEIEKSLFAAPADGAIQFDLEASRELLLLYSIASEVVEADAPLSLPGVGEVPSNEEALATQPVPLIDLDLNEPEPVVAHGLDLDVDFTVLESPPPAATSAAPPRPSLDLDLDALVPGRFR